MDLTPTHAVALTALAVGTGTISAGTLLAYSVFMPRCQFWAAVIRSIPDRQGVAVTFDDGPDPRFTPQILDILAARNIKATFFVIGRYAKQNSALLRRIHDEGHNIGNHSLDHDHFGVNKNLAYWRTQIGETQKIIADITGQPPYLFRPPMGFKTWHIARAARELKLPIIGWSVRALDTKNISHETVTCRILKNISGHDIVVLHDGVEPNRPNASQERTVQALPAILDGIEEKELQTYTLLEALLPSESAPVGAGT